MKIKKQIEQLYINAVYNDEAPSTFAEKVAVLFGKDLKETRSSLQSRSRWKYLTMVAIVLNDSGQTYTPPGTTIQMRWNKDLLYEIYWQSSRAIMYPKKGKQLNTKEFCDLADSVMDLFAVLYEINIPFPNIKDLIKPIEPR